jgi:glucosamine kinase
MYLIADSGSTKTKWWLVSPDGDHTEYNTMGYNPYYLQSHEIAADIRHALLPDLEHHLGDIRSVYFYGAGVSTPEACAVIEAALQEVFTDARIDALHDMLAAARALCGAEAGIACILGTGSNSCLYDGTDITDNVPSLGFVLGDEGSGADLGRELLRRFFYRELPADLHEAFDGQYHLTKGLLLEAVYQKPLPNRYVASYAEFVIAHQKHPVIRELIKGRFAEFVRRQPAKYARSGMLPIHFLGSIAYMCQDIMAEVLADAGLRMGIFLRGPMERLVAYHMKY